MANDRQKIDITYRPSLGYLFAGLASGMAAGMSKGFFSWLGDVKNPDGNTNPHKVIGRIRVVFVLFLLALCSHCTGLNQGQYLRSEEWKTVNIDNPLKRGVPRAEYYTMKNPDGSSFIKLKDGTTYILPQPINMNEVFPIQKGLCLMVLHGQEGMVGMVDPPTFVMGMQPLTYFVYSDKNQTIGKIKPKDGWKNLVLDWENVVHATKEKSDLKYHFFHIETDPFENGIICG